MSCGATSSALLPPACWRRGRAAAGAGAENLAGPVAGLRWASANKEGCARCVRALDLFYQWRDEKCHQHEGTGVGANLQEVRRAGHRSAADLPPASWVFVQVRERTHESGRCGSGGVWPSPIGPVPAGRRWCCPLGGGG